MADYEGYLLLHSNGRFADVMYFELGNGYLQYYTQKNGNWLGQLALTRNRIIVKEVYLGVSPHRFTVDFIPTRSVHDTDRMYPSRKKVTLLLSASNANVQKQWMYAFQSWRRRNWRDSVIIGGQEKEMEALKDIMLTYRMQNRLLTTYGRNDSHLQKVAATPEEPNTEKEVEKHIEPITHQSIQFLTSYPSRVNSRRLCPA